MPKYPWIIYDDMKLSDLENKINAMITLGVPYPEDYAKQARQDLEIQAIKITDGLKSAGIETSHTKEIIAIIAYLQRLGTDIMVPETSERTEEESDN
jgi:cytochrome c oxidase cbb3-type subunit I/II